MENHKENMRADGEDGGRLSLNRFPLVGLAMILTCAAAGYGILYLCFSLASE